MKVIILGAGRRGLLMARQLIAEDNDVVLIDSDPARIEDALSRLDCMGIVGSGMDVEVLKSADCEHADAFIAVSDSDEINLVSCGIVSTEFGETKTVAAIRNITYTGQAGLKGALLGIDYIANPDEEAAKSLHAMIESGIFGNAISFTRSDLLLFTFSVKHGSPFADKHISALRGSMDAEFIVAAINRSGTVFVPSGTSVIKVGDTVSLVAKDADIDILRGSAGYFRKRPKSIVMVGGTRIAHLILKEFPPETRTCVALVDRNREVCEQFASHFPGILVLNAAITDDSVFEEEHLASYDLLLSLTDSDELNIITASYAKRAGNMYSVALIRDNNNYVRLASMLDIDAVISTTEATADSLLRFLRGDNVSSLHLLFKGQLEVYEFTLSAEAEVCGKHLKEIDIRGKGIVAGITDTDGRDVIPTGEYLLKAGETVLVTVSKKHAEYIRRLFD
ncbi:Trk system potassium transporter TrkA [Parasphaerochaeta coccoides]|uniref:Trk system potassium uptake protein TrkA n=1 Tax=Parasphaerochaeta coccoides (strain ATCC BAA-1237 / DSM 17374 / SPN1) TaxID=760011 RepID=F4GL49_PARC1|nr:Trk system potassium transporter TrkA [Parasphaerochaeta coccoides]AEC02389.1 TrkA-N domain protein [Parasphaerochaeta coccoides DSM 17374]